MSVVILAAWLGVARAEFSVTGQGDQLRVQATDARIEDVIATLRDRYGLIYRNDIALDQTITGSYSGSLDRVVKQIMRRYDYALKSRDGHVELLVTNQVKSTAATTPVTQPAGDKPAVSSVTAALQVQANQLAAMNAPQQTAGQPPAAGASSSTIIGAGMSGNSGASSAAGSSGAPTAASMAELTQRASGTVRDLAQALSRIAP